MKKLMIFAIIGLIIGANYSASGQENKKAAKARKHISEAKNDLREAKLDSTEDFKKFKLDAETKITANQTKIAELKAKKTGDNKEINEKYNRKVMALREKNDALKKRIDNADNTKTNMWAEFKKEFNHDMDELGHAIRDIGVNNVK